MKTKLPSATLCLLFGLCALSALTTGCKSINPVNPVPDVRPVRYDVSAKEAQIRLQTVSDSTDPAAKGLSDKLVSEARKVFVNRGFVVDQGEPDVKVVISPTLKQFDQAGEYYVFTGKAEATLVLPKKAGRLAAPSPVFSAKGERKFGRDEAVDDVADKLAVPLRKWASDEVTVEKTGLAACEIAVVCVNGDLEEDVEYIDMFVHSVRAMPSVCNCELVEQDLARRIYTFRAIYAREQYPQGFLNALILAKPELKLGWKK